MKSIQLDLMTPPIGYDLITNEIPQGSKVLDLGCGDGALLDMLRKIKNIDGYGVELSAEGVSTCLERGLYAYQGDIDDGLADYRANSFDYVILNQTLQDTKRPIYVLQEIMRICLNAIIGFPNFGYIRNRLQLLYSGSMPKNRLFPYDWYESPNIHLLSIKDFQSFCKLHTWPVKKQLHFSTGASCDSRPVRTLPNLLAQYGLFILDGEKFTGTARV